jgi:putative endonuclease
LAVVAVSNDKSEKGRLGEDEAVRVLKKRGYKILDRNFRARFGEIDIIARQGETVVFVEVKARSDKDARFGTPAEAVGRKKQERIIKSAYEWLRKDKKKDRPVRFDVVEVIMSDGAMETNIIEDAFGAER